MARRCVLQCDPEPVERTVGQIKTRGKRSCINFAWEEGRGGGGGGYSSIFYFAARTSRPIGVCSLNTKS